MLSSSFWHLLSSKKTTRVSPKNWRSRHSCTLSCTTMSIECTFEKDSPAPIFFTNVAHSPLDCHPKFTQTFPIPLWAATQTLFKHSCRFFLYCQYTLPILKCTAKVKNLSIVHANPFLRYTLISSRHYCSTPMHTSTTQRNIPGNSKKVCITLHHMATSRATAGPRKSQNKSFNSN